MRVVDKPSTGAEPAAGVTVIEPAVIATMIAAAIGHLAGDGISIEVGKGRVNVQIVAQAGNLHDAQDLAEHVRAVITRTLTETVGLEQTDVTVTIKDADPRAGGASSQHEHH